MKSILFSVYLLCQSAFVLSIVPEHQPSFDDYNQEASYLRSDQGYPNEYQTSLEDYSVQPYKVGIIPGMVNVLRDSLRSGFNQIRRTDVTTIMDGIGENGQTIAMVLWVVVIFSLVAFKDSQLSDLWTKRYEDGRKRRSINERSYPSAEDTESLGSMINDQRQLDRIQRSVNMAIETYGSQ